MLTKTWGQFDLTFIDLINNLGFGNMVVIPAKLGSGL